MKSIFINASYLRLNILRLFIIIKSKDFSFSNFVKAFKKKNIIQIIILKIIKI